jgi:hypothetical protein
MTMPLFSRQLAAGVLSSVLTLVAVTAQAASSLSLSPAASTYNPGQSFAVDIIADAPATAADTSDNLVVADVIVNFDNTVLQLDSIDTSSGSSAFYSTDTSTVAGFPVETIDNGTGQGQVIVGLPTPGVDGASLAVARLNFTVLGGATLGDTSVDMAFTAAGDAGDSNLILNDGQGTDDLDSVTNATFTIATASVDSDSDGIPDSSDNCTLAANPGQLDADSDNYGNACDADYNNDGTSNSLDVGLFRNAFATNDAIVDHNEDGAVNSLDIGVFRNIFGSDPGPSGLAQ